MTLSSVSLICRLARSPPNEDNRPPLPCPRHGAGGILPGHTSSENRGGISVELKSLTEQKSLLAELAARQTDPAAPAAVRVRPRQRHPDAAADRPGHRARPARLLPQPGLEGPRLPVPARGRGRLLGPRLPDRDGEQVLPRLRRPGAADPQGQRQDRHPVLGEGLLELQRQRRGRGAARRRRGRLHALRRLPAPGRGPRPAARGSARTATATGCR